MKTIQNLRSFRHLSSHIFFLTKVYVELKKTRKDVYSHLQKMRKSIITMNLSYTDIDRLKQKIGALIELERKYARLFKPEDAETQELKRKAQSLQNDLDKANQEKEIIIEESTQKISQFTESINSLKSKINFLLIDKARRHHRYKSIEQKIKKEIDVHQYYNT